MYAKRDGDATPQDGAKRAPALGLAFEKMAADRAKRRNQESDPVLEAVVEVGRIYTRWEQDEAGVRELFSDPEACSRDLHMLLVISAASNELFKEIAQLGLPHVFTTALRAAISRTNDHLRKTGEDLAKLLEEDL